MEKSEKSTSWKKSGKPEQQNQNRKNFNHIPQDTPTRKNKIV